MTLIDDLVAGASGEVPLSSLLRQVKVLASRTGAGVLRDWVDLELSGYPSTDHLPAYRGPFRLVVLADFYGPSGRGVKNQQIHPAMFPADLRESSLFQMWLTDSVAELEHLAAQDEVTLTWPPDGEVLFHHLYRAGRLNVDLRGMELAQVRCPVSSTVYVKALDAVRTKVLDLALEIEQVAPTAGQSDGPASDRQRAANIINYHFHGTTSVAIGAAATQLVIGLPGPGNREELVRYLAAGGIAPDLLVSLNEALDADSVDDAGSPSREFTRTRKWFTSAATVVGTGAAGDLLASAAASFLSG